MTVRRKPEVLAPGGNVKNLKTAIDFGADAVYAGGKDFGMRTASKNLSLEEFDEAVTYAHERGARVFVTCNILPDNDEVDAMNRYLGELVEVGVDALIVTDIGVLSYAHDTFPDMELHISTQAGVTNYQAANALHRLGASRVVLARELSLDDVRQIRAKTSEELEIEAFVHGSMCMAFSGRCLISQHLTGRDANHGDCAQSCRWKYHVMEEKRPGELIPVEVTEEGTFLFNSHDMNLLPHVPEIIDAGVTSLKIEGRAKSNYYVAAMANAYKQAVNEYMVQRGFETPEGEVLRPFHDQVRPPEGTGEPTAVVLPTWLHEEPMKVSHREYSTGFYFPDEPASENVVSGVYLHDWILVGIVTGYDAAEQRLYFQSKNKIVPGQRVEFLAPQSAPLEHTVPATGMRDADGEPVDLINVPAKRFSMPCPFEVPAGAMMRSVNPRAQAIRLPVI